MSITLETARSVVPLIEAVDREFWSAHPDLKRKKLSRDDNHAKLRAEWKRLFKKRAIEAVGVLVDANRPSPADFLAGA